MTSPSPSPSLAPLTIERYRGGSVRWLAGAVVLALVAGWAATPGVAGQADGSAGTLRLLAVGAVLAAVACAVRGWRLYADRTPGLLLDAAGIIDGVSSARAGLVPWAEVTGLAVLHVRHRFMLVVQLADPQKYIAAAPAFRRPLAEADLRLCGSPVALPDGALRMDFDELVKTVHAHFAVHRPAAVPAVTSAAAPA